MRVRAPYRVDLCRLRRVHGELGDKPVRRCCVRRKAEAGGGVAITPDDLYRIGQFVEAEIQASSPEKLLPPGSEASPRALHLRIVITRYDEGSAAARLLLAGLGQILIDGMS